MSFPRTTDVSKHLARKPRHPAKLRLEPTPVTHSANKELELLKKRLSAAVRDTHNRLAPGGGQ